MPRRHGSARRSRSTGPRASSIVSSQPSAGRAPAARRRPAPPTTAVSTPSGISIRAAVRATRVDQHQEGRADQHRRPAARRSKRGPTSRRAMCGTTSPIQPMTPEIATTRRRDQRRGRDHDAAHEAATFDAERPGLVVAERQHADAPAQQARAARGPGAPAAPPPHVADLDARQAAEQPEGDGGQLVVGIGQDLHQRDAGAGQRADDDAGQHQHQDLVLAAQRAGQRR